MNSFITTMSTCIRYTPKMLRSIKRYVTIAQNYHLTFLDNMTRSGIITLGIRRCWNEKKYQIPKVKRRSKDTQENKNSSHCGKQMQASQASQMIRLDLNNNNTFGK